MPTIFVRLHSLLNLVIFELNCIFLISLPNFAQYKIYSLVSCMRLWRIKSSFSTDACNWFGQKYSNINNLSWKTPDYSSTSRKKARVIPVQSREPVKDLAQNGRKGRLGCVQSLYYGSNVTSLLGLLMLFESRSNHFSS